MTTIKLVDSRGASILVKNGSSPVESSMLSIITIVQHCQRLEDMLKTKVPAGASLPTWWTSEIALAEQAIIKVTNYLAADIQLEGAVEDSSQNAGFSDSNTDIHFTQ